MKLFSENEWLDFFKVVGFQSINSWRFGEKDSWGGTLIITGLK